MKKFRQCFQGLICGIILSLLTFSGKAQEFNAQLVLPFDQGIIREIKRDSIGFLWVATHNGLIRYDGHKTKTYEPGKPGCSILETAYFYSIQPLGGGDLLVGTNAQGLLRYIADQDSLVQVVPAYEDSTIFLKGSPRKILDIGKGKFLISFSYGGTHIIEYDINLNVARSLFRKDGNLSGSGVLKQNKLYPNLIWFTTESLQVLDLASGEIIEHPSPYDKTGELLVQSMEFPGGDTLLIGTMDALYYYHTDTKIWEKDTLRNITLLDMARIENGNTLISNIPFRFYKSGQITDIFDNTNPITSIHTEGNHVWIGVINKGVYYFDFNASKISYRRVVPAEDLRNRARLITNAWQKDSETWYSAFGAKPLYMERDGIMRGITSGREPELDVMDFLLTEDENWLLATHQGFWKYDALRDTFSEKGAITQTLDQILPYGKKAHILIGKSAVFRYQNDMVSSLRAHCGLLRNALIYNDSLFVLSSASLYRLDGDSLKKLEVPFSMAQYMVVNQGTIWVSADHSMYTYTNGIWTHRPFANNRRLELTRIHADTLGRIWGLSAEGLTWFSPSTMVAHVLNKSDGLSYTDISGIRMFRDPDAPSKFLLGQATYLAEIDPDLFGNTEAARPIFTDITVMGEALRQGSDPCGNDTIDLPYFQNYIRFEFAAPFFKKTEKKLYKFQLEGYEDIWHFTSEIPEAYYTGIPPGNYKFLVKPADATDERQTLSKWVFIQPPYWQTTWFRTLMVMLLLGSFAAIYFLNVRRIRRQEKLRREHLIEVNSLEMKAIRAQMNPHFIFNCLNSIRSCIMEGREEEAIDYIGKFGKLMRLVLDLSRSQKTVLKDEIDMLRLYISLEELRMDKTVNTDLQTDAAVNPEKIKIPGMVIQPLVENALWHGLNNLDREPLLQILFRKKNPSELEVVVEDNGHGRSMNNSAHHTSHAMNMIDERLKAETLSGKPASMNIFDLRDSNGNGIGTRIILTFTV